MLTSNLNNPYTDSEVINLPTGLSFFPWQKYKISNPKCRNIVYVCGKFLG